MYSTSAHSESTHSPDPLPSFLMSAVTTLGPLFVVRVSSTCQGTLHWLPPTIRPKGGTTPDRPSKGEYEAVGKGGDATVDETYKAALYAQWTEECNALNKPPQAYGGVVANPPNVGHRGAGPRLRTQAPWQGAATGPG